MIKKFVIAIVSLVVAGVIGYYLSNLVHDKAVPPEALPGEVNSFLTKYFKEEKIAFSKMDRDFLKISYEVILSDGTKLEFNSSGEWKEINGHHKKIPDGIIPDMIALKIAELYRQSYAVKAEKDGRNLEIELSNGLELKFDKNFNLISIDR